MTSNPHLRIPKRRRLDFAEEVTILVGKDQNSLTVHRCILTRTSNYCETSCATKPRLEPIELRKVCPNTFSIYLQWLYTGVLVTGHGPEDDLGLQSLSSSSSSSRERHYLEDLMELWQFAEIVDDKALANDVVDATTIAANEIDVFDRPLIIEPLEHIPRASGFYKLVLDLITKPEGWDFSLGFEKYLTKDFLLDIVEAFVRARDNDD